MGLIVRIKENAYWKKIYLLAKVFSSLSEVFSSLSDGQFMYATDIKLAMLLWIYCV